jgi:hypothetical protein
MMGLIFIANHTVGDRSFPDSGHLQTEGNAGLFCFEE